MSTTRLTKEQRATLARDAFIAVFECAETFTDDNVGAHLAYLMGAILDDTEEQDNHVDWSIDVFSVMGPEDQPVWEPPLILSALQLFFPPEHPIWQFIIL